MVTGTVGLFCTDHVLADLEFGELNVHIENYRCANVFTFEQETESGTPITKSKKIISLARNYLCKG